MGSGEVCVLASGLLVVSSEVFSRANASLLPTFDRDCSERLLHRVRHLSKQAPLARFGDCRLHVCASRHAVITTPFYTLYSILYAPFFFLDLRRATRSARIER